MSAYSEGSFNCKRASGLESNDSSYLHILIFQVLWSIIPSQMPNGASKVEDNRKGHREFRSRRDEKSLASNGLHDRQGSSTSTYNLRSRKASCPKGQGATGHTVGDGGKSPNWCKETFKFDVSSNRIHFLTTPFSMSLPGNA